MSCQLWGIPEAGQGAGDLGNFHSTPGSMQREGPGILSPCSIFCPGVLPLELLPNFSTSSQPSCQHLPTPLSHLAWDMPHPCPHCTSLNNS